MEVVTVGPAGRVVLPRDLRRELGLETGSKILVVRVGDRLVLQSLDPKAVARAIAQELKGVDVDAIVREVKQEVEDEARRDLAAALLRHQSVRGSRAKRAPRHAKP